MNNLMMGIGVISVLLSCLLANCKSANPAENKYDEIVIMSRESEKTPEMIVWINDEPVLRFPNHEIFNDCSFFPLAENNIIRFVYDDNGFDMKAVFSKINVSMVSRSKSKELPILVTECLAEAKFHGDFPRPLPEGLRLGRFTRESEAAVRKWMLKLLERFEKGEAAEARKMIEFDSSMPVDTIWPMLQPTAQFIKRANGIDEINSVYGKSMLLIYHNYKVDNSGSSGLYLYKIKDSEFRICSQQFLIDDKSKIYLLSGANRLAPIVLDGWP